MNFRFFCHKILMKFDFYAIIFEQKSTFFTSKNHKISNRIEPLLLPFSGLAKII